ncbi:MAG: sarcosine oxidase subunit gamma [Pseudomonadota bacterium]
MSDYQLTARAPLGGLSIELGALSLTEIDAYALGSIAAPRGERTRLADRLGVALGLAMPAVGASSLSQDGSLRLLGLQQDQYFLMFKADPGAAISFLTEKVGDAGYVTDQSDSWAKLCLKGHLARQALSRLCMIDLHPKQFADGAVARTVMEHIGVILLKETDDSFVLFTPRSSVRSFVKVIEDGMRSCSNQQESA